MSGISYHDYKIIIIYHTKCAQTTLYEVFGKPWGDANNSIFDGRMDGLSDHEGIDSYILKWPGYFKATFIRNPYDRMVSGYHYFKQHNPEHFENISFEDYVNGIDKDPPEFSPLIPLSHYINVSVEDIDFIGRFENLYDDIRTLAGKFNRKVIDIPHLTKSVDREKPDYREYYTNDKTIEVVTRLYEKDLKIFDYKF